jgi:hypothetical protein
VAATHVHEVESQGEIAYVITGEMRGETLTAVSSSSAPSQVTWTTEPFHIAQDNLPLVVVEGPLSGVWNLRCARVSSP